MSNFFYNLVPFAIGAVAIVLVLGLVNMMRGGSPNTSQKADAPCAFCCNSSPSSSSWRPI